MRARIMHPGLQLRDNKTCELWQVATETAATLDGQTKQMEGVLNSLDEIHFSLKKANQVIRDITRRIATDKCAPARHSHILC